MSDIDEWAGGKEREGLEAKLRAEVAANRTLRQRLKTAEEQLAEYEKVQAARDSLALSEVTISDIPRTKGKGHKATPVLVISDVHCGELVDSRTVNGVNAYNPDICKRSMENIFDSALSCIDVYRHGVQIKDMVLAVLGDIMTGHLHDDHKESNPLTPPEELLFCQDILASCLRFLLDQGKFERITIPCAFGNHGRATIKPRAQMAARMSWEWMLYHQLARHFEREKRVEFMVPDGIHCYSRVHNTVVRWTHGDRISYRDGVGGISIPINKAVTKWDSVIGADLTVMGHWHQLTDLGKVVVNGSVLGYSAYSLDLKASKEPAQQALFLIDEKYGKRAFEPIRARREAA